MKAQQWTAFNAMDATNPFCTVSSSTNDSVVFSVKIPGMYSVTVDSLQRIHIPGHNKMDSVGFPELPVVSYLIAIPDCDSVVLSFTPTDSLFLDNWNIYPAPEIIVDTTAQGYEYLAEEFNYDTTFYNTDTLFPSSNAELVDRGAFRDQHCIRVELCPIQFNPVDNQLKVFSGLKIKLTFTNAHGSVNEDVGIFNEIARNAMINYESNGKNASINTAINNDTIGSWQWIDTFPNGHLNVPCDYLLITHEDFYDDTAARNAINKLAQHRAYFNGFDVVMVKTEDIYDDFSSVSQDSSVRIRELLINVFEDDTAHHTYDGKLGYLCLFGDTFFDDNSVCVPSNRWIGNYENNGGEDSYFARLTYNSSNDPDIYPDIFCGRLSVDNTEQVKNVVNKIVDFSPSVKTYRNNFLQYVGNDQSHYDSYHRNFERVYEILPGDSMFIFSKDDYDNLYNYPGWTYKKPYTINNLLGLWGKGISIVNYCGHGGPNALVSNDFEYEDLTSSQDNVLPYGLITACHTGQFHCVDECFTEKMLNQNRYRGMIGVIGARRVSGADHLGYFNYNSLIFNSPVIGSAFLESQIIHEPLLYTYNLFGDPALNLFYENIDTLRPDIIVNEVYSDKALYMPDDTVKISAIISNIMAIDIEDSFISSCFIKKIDDTVYTIADSYQTDSLQMFVGDTLDFSVTTSGYEEAYYEIKVVIDTANVIIELSEINNTESIIISLSRTNSNLLCSSIDKSIKPICYNFVDSSEVQEIIVGTKVLDFNENVIIDHSKSASYQSSIGFTNDTSYFINSFSITGNYICTYDKDSIWVKNPSNSEIFGESVLYDLDINGIDDVLFCETEYNDPKWEFSLSSLDDKCNQNWKLSDYCYMVDDTLNEPKIPNIFTPLAYYNIEDEEVNILLPKGDSVIYIAAKNVLGNYSLSDSITLDNCLSVSTDPLLCDLNYNNEIFLVITYNQLNGDGLNSLAMIKLSDNSIDTVHIDNSLTGSKPFLFDINSDGGIEVVFTKTNKGIWFYDDQLNQTYLQDTLFQSLIGFCDLNSDNIIDILYESKEEEMTYIKGITYQDSLTLQIPMPFNSGYKSNYFVTDKENDRKPDIVANIDGTLWHIECQFDADVIDWKGDRGNIKKNSLVMQPAYYISSDTVYWTDNISIPDTFEIPYGSTVIIKPGTHIYAKEDAEFIVYGKLIAKGTEYHPIKFTANILGADKDHWGGITAKTNGVAELQYCQIENAEVGLFLYSRSPEDVENNTFKNNEVGLCTYANSPDIIENYFTGNNIAVACHASSGPKFVGGSFGTVPYYNGLIENDTAISIYNSLPVVKDGYNDIYNDTLGIYMVFVDEYPRSPLNARNNYYGSTDTSEVIDHFVPEAYFSIYPVLSSAQTNFKNLTTSPAEELLATAWQNFYDKKYYSASQYFQQVIDNYPTTNEALYAINGEFDAYKFGSLGWSGFSENMDELLQDSIFNTNIEKYAFEYINLALRMDGQYSDAIENYQNEISNPQGYYDSLYAVINLSNTLLESGGYKSSAITSMVEDKLLSSDFSHIVRTKELLFSQPKESQETLTDNQCLKILSVFPVPSGESATVEFASCNEGSLMVDVFSATGIKVYNNQTYLSKGYNTLNFKHCLPPGIYIIRLTNNENSVSKRIIIK